MVFNIGDEKKLRIQYLTGEEIHLLELLKTPIHN
jgi:hypothetical protein